MAGLGRVACLLALCTVLLQGLRETGGAGAEAQEVTPYLLFTTQRSIYRLYLNGSDAEEILRPANFGVIAIDYHYRLNYMFWIDTTHPLIMRARLNGSEVTRAVIGDLSDPTDLAVDWINDKVYWVDRGLRRIEEYDILSGHRRVVASTGNVDQSSPGGLALYPYPNHGWLYWYDTIRRSIEMVSVTGDNRATFHGDLDQIGTVSVDYTTHTLYWISQFTYEIEAIRLDRDASTHSYPFSRPIFFASAMAIYQNLLFWAETRGVYRANMDVEDDIVQMFATGSTRATGVQVVHPSQQPLAEEYVNIVANTSADFTFSCSSDCINGSCIPPGLCACNAGWKGEDCSIDKDECSENNGGCSYQCTNLVGGFQCSCRAGYALSDDQLTCTDLNECEGSSHGCQQRCINQEGSYSCGCNIGYMLNEDGKTCTAIECTATTVTVTDAPSSASTFDPCLYILPKTSSSSVTFTSSAMLNVGPPTSTVEILPSRSVTAKITSSSVVPTSMYIQRDTIGHISPSSSMASSSVREHTSVHSQRTISSTVGQSIYLSSSAPSKDTSSSVEQVDTTTTAIAGTTTLHVLRSREMSASDHVSPTVTSYTTNVTPTPYSKRPPSVQPDSTRTRPPSSASEEPVVSSTTATTEALTTEEALQPKSSSLVPFSPDVDIPEGQKSREGNNNIALMVGAACGAVLVIVVVVTILVAVCVCCAHQKRRSGSWSPSSPKHNGTVSPTSMKALPDTNSSCPSKV